MTTLLASITLAHFVFEQSHSLYLKPHSLYFRVGHSCAWKDKMSAVFPSMPTQDDLAVDTGLSFFIFICTEGGCRDRFWRRGKHWDRWQLITALERVVSISSSTARLELTKALDAWKEVKVITIWDWGQPADWPLVHSQVRLIKVKS